MNSTNESLLKPAPATPAAEAAASSAAKLRMAAVVLALLVIIGAVAGLVPRWQRRATLRTETRELALQTVAVVSAVPGQATEGLVLPAEVKPIMDAPIYARSSGYLSRWLVDMGAEVQEGDLLAQTDAPELRQELARAKAELLQAEAGLTLARTTAARWAELLKTSSVSEQEAAEKEADFELKQANTEAARANVRRLEELQGFSSIRAPFAGTITMRGVDVGQLVVAGSTKELFHLAQTGTLRVYVRVPQMASRGIRVGQLAQLMVPEFPGRIFPAKVVRTAGAMSPDSRTLLTELEVDNSNHEILADTFAQVRFKEPNLQANLVLPSNTLIFRSEGTQVGVVSSDNRVQLRNVSLGRDFGPTVEILSGIAPTDRVILNPADSLVGGGMVRVLTAEPSKPDLP